MFTPISTLVTLALLVSSGLAAPQLTPVNRVKGQKKPGSYIVRLKADASRSSLLAELGPAVSTRWQKKVLNGFAGNLNSSALDLVRSHPDVESITEDGIFTTGGALSKNPPVRRSTETMTNEPWGLQRISQSAPLVAESDLPLSYTYRYDSDGQGEGVDVYVLDSGILTTHNEFEGRATWGATFGGYADADGLGHGTHCAGTVAGRWVGVAKKAHVIAVKALSDQDFGYWSDMISGVDWIMTQAATSGRPSSEKE